MSTIPLPEILVVVTIALITYGVRVLRQAGSSRERLDAESRISAAEATPLEHKRAQLVASCVAIAVISVPLILEVVPPNGIYGFRTGVTMSRPDLWYPANAFLGWALLAASVVSATLLMTLPARTRRWLLWTAFLVPTLAAIAVSFAYLERLR